MPLMNEEQIAKMAKWKLLGHNSCADCTTDQEVIDAIGR